MDVVLLWIAAVFGINYATYRMGLAPEVLIAVFWLTAASPAIGFLAYNVPTFINREWKSEDPEYRFAVWLVVGVTIATLVAAALGRAWGRGGFS